MLITIGHCEFDFNTSSVCGAEVSDWKHPGNLRAWVRLVARDRGVDPRRLLRDFEVGDALDREIGDICRALPGGQLLWGGDGIVLDEAGAKAMLAALKDKAARKKLVAKLRADQTVRVKAMVRDASR